MGRLTNRADGKVYLGKRPRGALCPGVFCKNGRTCEMVSARTCPYLAALDRLALYEDAEEEGRLILLDTTPGDDYDGLERKYIVFKNHTGVVVDNCFVLRPDRDKAARRALLAYAYFIHENNELLAKDLIRWVNAIEEAEHGGNG